MRQVYTGRFAPSPTGPLHAGSLVAALASWLDARAHGGRWLVRIEDADRPRCPPGMGERILQQLAGCALLPDEPPLWQSTRDATYRAALEQLARAGCVYPCRCTRRAIESALQARGIPLQRDADRVYPGTCRPAPGTGSRTIEAGSTTRAGKVAWRLRLPLGMVAWHDRRLGAQRQDVAREVGDFVLLRADGLWAYQLAVVVDDAAQGVTDVVRGEDLAESTARQIVLQRALGLPVPRYLHTPLVLAPDGHKLSKQSGAAPLELADRAAVLRTVSGALRMLGLQVPAAATTLPALLDSAVQAWAARWARDGAGR
jgi:glutamyl-Q tRNA(Asp) synthetase